MLDRYKTIPSKKAEHLANSLLARHFIDKPNDIDLEGILAMDHGYVFYQPMSAAQGRIVMRDDSAIITVNSNVENPRKMRFILAHEMGHFVMHRKLTRRTYNCYEKDLISWSDNKSAETEANEFAAAILMPSKLFRKVTTRRGLNLSIMEELQETFNTSFTATAIRYTQLGDVPCALISMKEGLVEFARCSNDFPGRFISHKTRIPFNTVAHDVWSGEDPPDRPVKVRLKDWYRGGLEERDIRKNVNEICITSAKHNLILSLLWMT